MIFYRIFGFLVSVAAVWAVWSQLLAPALNGRQLFPIFRSRTRALEEQLVEVNQQIADRQLADEIEVKKQTLNKDKSE
jgi:hypothetical protein